MLRVLRKLKPETVSFKKYSRDPVIAGIKHGRKAFIGPEQVVIDPTNRCNLQCSACWLYSPLLDKDKPDKDCLNQELPGKVLFNLIDDLSSLGTKRVRFTGGGEPFLHKDLMQAVEYSVNKGLLVSITSNFLVLTKKQIKKLLDLKIDELAVSIWAGDAGGYSKVHPGGPWDCFDKLLDNLSYLKEIKKDKPRVTFSNVITNENFSDLETMYDFGVKYGADGIYFTIVDVLAGQTDKLLLDGAQREELLRQGLLIKEKNRRDRLQLEFFDGFINRLSAENNAFSKGEYDKTLVNKIPCYAGWNFSRVLADGKVVPCCRGVKKVMGNLNSRSFKDIWFSHHYDEFRCKAKYLSKADTYFKDIGCMKECDNLMHNQATHRIITSF